MCKNCKKSVKLVSAEKNEKRDIKLNRKTVSIYVRPSVWKAFKADAKARKLSIVAAVKDLVKAPYTPKKIAEAVNAFVEAQGLPSRFDNREAWVNACLDLMRPEFEARGHTLPEKIRISIGWPGGCKPGKALGQCYSRAASTDGYNEIFLSPHVDTTIDLADILTHELCHAVDDCQNGHRKAFAAIGDAMGLIGKPRFMRGHESDAWRSWALPLIDALGPIPHKALDPNMRAKPKQSTRMIKCECESCGFVFRAARKPIEEAAETVRIKGKIRTYLNCPSPMCASRIYLELETKEDAGE